MPEDSRQHFYDQAFEVISVNKGTPYPCTKKEIVSLTQPRWYKLQGLSILKGFVSPEEATVKLEQALYPSNTSQRSIPSPQHDAIKRLRAMKSASIQTPAGPDIVIKAFNDLDKVFFSGRLKGRTMVRWITDAQMRKTAPPYEPSHSSCLGCAYTIKSMGSAMNYAVILLNAQSLLLKPRLDCFKTACKEKRDAIDLTWAVLLHEMVHVYLITLTGFDTDRDEDAEGFDGGHGRHFQRCIHAVNMRIQTFLGWDAVLKYHGDGGKSIKPFDAENHVLTLPNPGEKRKWKFLRILDILPG